MKRTTVATLALAVSLGAQPLLAEDNQTTSEAVKQLWQVQQKAFDAHDLDGVMQTFADGDDIMLMGTGPGEHWVGQDEIKDAFKHFMGNFDPNTMKAKCKEGVGHAMEDVAWFTEVCRFRDRKDGKARKFVANLSGVVIKQDDGWRFHSMHYSQVIGGDPATAPASAD
ncbi:YybH family protein [Rhabdochromatium marinum]|uniref:YybH family protein n=1 Tax=Rhabdochromatium marinum TaxID=48729 RepID=UPI001902F41C|nr:nuclear transport factor 2 family protein [Rhabdochromatium marinum]MBK1650209.1 hypothetical protein [Rhabdochromatium marinum]